MDFRDHQFLFVTGKGGVGKTTFALALGAHYAALDRKVAVVSTRGNSQLLSLAGLESAPEPVAIAERLFVCAIDPDASMKQYVEHQLHSTALAHLLFQKGVAKGFLTGIPGLRQWALLGKAWFLSEKSASGPRIPHAPFDLVIFDAPSTGDSTELLKLPGLIADLVPLGPLGRDAGACRKLFADPTRFSTFVVTLAEELPVTETFELLDVLENELRAPIGGIVVNRFEPPLLEGGFAKRLLQEPLIEPSSAEARATLELLELGRAQALRQLERAKQLQRLQRRSHPLFALRTTEHLSLAALEASLDWEPRWTDSQERK